MGRSDSIIFDVYSNFCKELIDAKSIAFLGFSQENLFTAMFTTDVCHFYDIQLGNFDINSDFSLKQKYDLIVSTRCPYFSKEPDSFIDKCLSYLNPKGHLFLDWGLGDHWRYDPIMIGWKNEEIHQHAKYADTKQFLHSTHWIDDYNNDQATLDFMKSMNSHGYSGNIKDHIKKEVPSVSTRTKNLKKHKLVKLWEERPQLYILTMWENE